MTKDDFINYWKESALKDWNAVQGLFETKNYVQSLFFVHLNFEKLLKAHWVKNNTENHPPKIHNLIYFINIINLEIEDEFVEFARKMNDFQLEGRYPD